MPDSELTAVLQAAALAPSVHNTQPWRLDARGDVIDVRADRSRQLEFLDPSGRQLCVSCGAAAEFALLAVRAEGRACTIELLPDASDRELLARLRLADPVAPSADERRLADAIAVRYTDRGPYSDEPVPPAVLGDMTGSAIEVGAWALQLSTAEHRGVVIGVLAAAEAAEAADPRYAEELARWSDPAGSRPEGLPPAAVAATWPADRVSDVPLRDFTGANRHPAPGEAEPPNVERDTLVLIGTDHDDQASWLSAGRALARVLLRAAAAGLSAQPLGQAIDVESGRDRLRRELRLVGYPQFLLRLGYGSGRPATRRRGVDDDSGQ